MFFFYSTRAASPITMEKIVVCNLFQFSSLKYLQLHTIYCDIVWKANGSLQKYGILFIIMVHLIRKQINNGFNSALFSISGWNSANNQYIQHAPTFFAPTNLGATEQCRMSQRSCWLVSSIPKTSLLEAKWEIAQSHSEMNDLLSVDSSLSDPIRAKAGILAFEVIRRSRSETKN